MDSCAELAAALLSRCPHLRIVATSRESFDITGETVWTVDPLAPEDASRLFVERARQRRADFVLDEDDEAVLAALCARLGHLPLGIELAAARVATMSVAEILASVETSLGQPRRREPARTGRCGPPSSGASSSSIPPSNGRSGGWRCSSAGSTPPRPRRSRPGCRP